MTIKNDVVVTCSDSSATFRNIQVNNLPISDNVVSSTYIDSYVNGTGTYTASYNNRIIYDNYIMTGTNTNVYPVLKYMIVITWESSLDNSYIQVEVKPTVSTPIIITRKTQVDADLEIQKSIIDALAESEDIQLIVDYLSILDTDLTNIYTYIQTQYPAILQRLLSIISLQQSANTKLENIYNTLTAWWMRWQEELLKQESRENEMASTVESKVEEQQSEQASLEAEMTYPTVDTNDVANNALDIADYNEANYAFISPIYMWLSHPLVIGFLITSTTFAVVGFVLYGKGGK